jgi:hypothetical protein
VEWTSPSLVNGFNGFNEAIQGLLSRETWLAWRA